MSVAVKKSKFQIYLHRLGADEVGRRSGGEAFVPVDPLLLNKEFRVFCGDGASDSGDD